jgi:hypothetical protein
VNYLTIAIGCLVVASWLSSGLLVRHALVRPRIGALTDRAIIAVIISIFGTVSVLLTLNTDTGWAFFAVDVARATFRLSVLALLFVPVMWLALYLTDRLR